MLVLLIVAECYFVVTVDVVDVVGVVC